MKVDRFDFELARELIAKEPASPRESARLLEVNGEKFSDFSIGDLPSLLRPSDIMVFNDTRVIPARIFGKRGDANVQVTLHKRLGANRWKAFAKPAKKLNIGDLFHIADDFSAEVTGKNEGEVELMFSLAGDELESSLQKYGKMPLPPYIERERGATEKDISDYQTIFAKEKGAVAAPTAGLHFTDNLFNKIDAQGIRRIFITLHVGAGTFLPVKVDDTKDHKMHAEEFIITDEEAAAINAAKAAGGRIIAVGTTSLRALESATDEKGEVHACSGDTDIFITPGYKFKCADVLLTNFHLPRSTLFMLVSAFAGEKMMHKAYKHAIQARYRFYSYGDATLLHRNDEI